MSAEKQNLYEFGRFRLDSGNRLLMCDGAVVSLTPKAAVLLEALVENRGNVLDKDKLMEIVWPGTFVEEANLSHHIYLLRKALGDDKNTISYIETVPKTGLPLHRQRSKN
jgi:DNA-binding winged helix-turn-helix (wHTH) protein